MRSRASVTVLACALFVTHCAARDEPDAAALLAAGQASLAAGDFDRAIDVLACAVAKRPDDVAYPLALASAYVAAHRDPAALRLLQNLRTRYPNDSDVALALARQYAAERDWRGVRDVLSADERRLSAPATLLLAEALRALSQPSAATELLRAAIRREPQDESLWLAAVDESLADGHPAAALKLVHEGDARIPKSRALRLRAAQAYLDLGQALGAAQLRTVPGGKPGMFKDGYLLAEKREGAAKFLCCPEASALYQVRVALDAGADDAAAHLLHARIWQRAGRPKTALAIVRSRESALLEADPTGTLALLQRLARDAGDIDELLRCARLATERRPSARDEILHNTYLFAAEHYNQCGDERLYVGFLRRALDLRPGDIGLMRRLADAEWAAGARGEAAGLYSRMMRVSPAVEDRATVLERIAEWQSGTDKPGD